MRNLKADVFAVGAQDWDRRVFDELIPLNEGTSYNAYLIKGSEKTALIDSVDPEKTDILVNNILRCGVEKIDYVVSNHCEQDHSGSIPDILMLYPEAKVVTNEKNKGFLSAHLHIEEDKFIVVGEDDTVSLGNKTLQFALIPWVHWPETMGTYLVEDKILFPCDMFGSHLATSDLFAEPDSTLYSCAKGYFAEIMMPFRTAIKKNLDKLSKFDIEMIAPSHGPVHKDPKFIMDAYGQWVGDKVENKVLMPFISMHGSTRKMVEYLTECLLDRDIAVNPFNLIGGNLDVLACDLVDSATVILAGPQVLAGAHPAVANAAFLANALRPKTKFATVIGSYGWGGKMVDNLVGMMPNLKVELFEPIMVKGLPREEDYALLEKLADSIVEKHKSIGIC
ncbi:MAG: FprA family A-type flavoprotein [Sedimentisphaeraceae bacterium JB056]